MGALRSIRSRATLVFVCSIGRPTSGHGRGMNAGKGRAKWSDLMERSKVWETPGGGSQCPQVQLGW